MSYFEEVITNRGQSCPNCGGWRVLGCERQPDGSPWHNSIAAGSPRIIEKCRECGDEAFDIYEVEE